MSIIPNLLSGLRAPLAFLFFFYDQALVRACLLMAAMISDALDGFIARRFGYQSKLGTLLDPIMDKFFVAIALLIFIQEQQLTIWEAATFLSRDIALILFAFFLLLKGQLANHRVRALWCGKISTALQFFILFALIFKVAISPFFYYLFIFFGILALFELYLYDYKPVITKENKELSY